MKKYYTTIITQENKNNSKTYLIRLPKDITEFYKSLGYTEFIELTLLNDNVIMGNIVNTKTNIARKIYPSKKFALNKKMIDHLDIKTTNICIKLDTNNNLFYIEAQKEDLNISDSNEFRRNVTFGKSGGTAGANSNYYSLNLPAKVIQSLNITSDNREIKIIIEDDKVILQKV